MHVYLSHLEQVLIILVHYSPGSSFIFLSAFYIYTPVYSARNPSSYPSCCCWTSSCLRISVSERIGWLKICWSCSCWTRGICGSNPLAASLLSRNDLWTLVYVCACLISLSPNPDIRRSRLVPYKELRTQCRQMPCRDTKFGEENHDHLVDWLFSFMLGMGYAPEALSLPRISKGCTFVLSFYSIVRCQYVMWCASAAFVEDDSLCVLESQLQQSHHHHHAYVF